MMLKGSGWFDPLAALCAALMVVGAAFGAGGCASHSTTAPVGFAVPMVDLAKRLIASPADSAAQAGMRLWNDDQRAEFRAALAPYMTEAEITARPDLFAIVGPAPGDSIPAQELYALAGKDVRGSSTESYYSVFIPGYSQTDPRWANKPLGFNYCGNSYIGPLGCYLTSCAMFYQTIGHPEANPALLDDWSCFGRSHYAFSTSQCGDLIRLAQAISYPNMSRPYHYITASQIQAELAANHFVLVHSGQYGNHYSPIYCWDGAKYWELDAEDGKTKPFVYTIKELIVLGS